MAATLMKIDLFWFQFVTLNTSTLGFWTFFIHFIDNKREKINHFPLSVY